MTVAFVSEPAREWLVNILLETKAGAYFRHGRMKVFSPWQLLMLLIVAVDCTVANQRVAMQLPYPSFFSVSLQICYELGKSPVLQLSPLLRKC